MVPSRKIAIALDRRLGSSQPQLATGIPALLLRQPLGFAPNSKTVSIYMFFVFEGQGKKF